jgi:hypothetical protein
MPKVTSKAKSGPKQSRRSAAKQQSDQLRNIRRRYERAAARYERQAESASGRERRELLKAASNLREQARQYYVKNITISDRGSSKYRADISRGIQRGYQPSLEQLAGAAQTADENRGRLIKNVLNSSTGDSFYAATIQLWRGTDYASRNETIVAEFQKRRPDLEVNDVLDVLDYFSKASGIDYLSPEPDEEAGIDERYRVKARIGAAIVQEQLLQ